MREFEGRVAVVTGGASGMGKAFAERFAREGMKVVLADVEQPALDATVLEFKQREYDVLGVHTDVADLASVEALAEQAVRAYGGVHILCNNAGVAGAGREARLWEHSMKDWQWVFDVNFWGVVHGIRTFLPIMLDQDDEGHVVNTASMAGLVGGAGLDIYGATKFAVVRISEALHLQLLEMGSKVKASVLCPGVVDTNIFSSLRNRPAELLNEGEAALSDTELEQMRAQRDERRAQMQAQAAVIEPETVAEQVFQAVRDEQFYILTHEELFDDAIRARMENILARHNPQPRPLQRPAGSSGSG